MRRVLTIFAGIGFLASFLIHLATFFSINPAKQLQWILFLSQGGGPAIRDGKYVLQSPWGRIIRELSEEEYERQKDYLAREFSAGWMMVYSFPLLHGLYREEE